MAGRLLPHFPYAPRWLVFDKRSAMLVGSQGVHGLNMRLYYEIAARAFRRASFYRGAALAGLVTNALFGAVLTFMYRAVYGSGGTVAGLSLEDCITYVWLMQSLISVGAAWMTWELMASIRSGDVVSDLAKPWSFYGYWLSRTLGERFFNLIGRGSCTYLVGVAFFGALSPDPGILAAFLAAIVLSMLVSFSVSFLVNMSGFWLLDASGAMVIANSVVMFFSGFLIPLAFLPPLLGKVASFLPFQAIAAVPAGIFLGKIAGFDAVRALALQAGWAAVLAAAGILVHRAALRRVVIQGG